LTPTQHLRYNLEIARDRDAPRQLNMTDTTRLRIAMEIRARLWELMTEEEQALYPVLDHLHDFIDDLK
jgi:hypothetical protein